MTSARLSLMLTAGRCPRPLHGASSNMRSKELGGYGGPPAISTIQPHTQCLDFTACLLLFSSFHVSSTSECSLLVCTSAMIA